MIYRRDVSIAQHCCAVGSGAPPCSGKNPSSSEIAVIWYGLISVLGVRTIYTVKYWFILRGYLLTLGIHDSCSGLVQNSSSYDYLMLMLIVAYDVPYCGHSVSCLDPIMVLHYSPCSEESCFYGYGIVVFD